MELSKIKTDVVTQAKKIDSMATPNALKFLWCPHNYRLKISKNKIPIALSQEIKSAIKLQSRNDNTIIKYTERTNKITIRNFNNITIEINPSCIIAIYPSEKWYLLKGSMKEINKRLDGIVSKIERKCVKEIKKIINVLKLEVSFNSKKWVRHEDHIKSDEFLGKIDPDLVMHDVMFKKVYPEGIEFKSPFNLKKFVNNRAIEMVSPQIVQAINNNTLLLNEFTEVIKQTKNIMEEGNAARHLEIYNKQLHQKVLEDISATMKHLNSNILKVKYKGRRLSGLERMLIK